MREFAGMKIVENPYLGRGQMLVISPEAMSLLPSIDFDFDPKPYDKSKVPDGHIPVRLVTEKVELFDCDRYMLNNALIDLFGTKPEPVQFTINPFALPPNPCSIGFFAGT